MATFAPAAPEIPGLGARGGMKSKAWNLAWRRLYRGEWLSAEALAIEISRETGLKTESIRKLFSSIERETDVLDKEVRLEPVTVSRGNRSFQSRRGHIYYRARVPRD